MTKVKRILQVFKTPSHRQLVLSGAALLLLLALIGAALYVYFNTTLGWFARNRKTDSAEQGMRAFGKEVTVSIYDEEMTYIGDMTSGAAIPFDLDIPGSEVVFVLRVHNLSDSAVSIDSILFPAPSATEEVPVTVTEAGTPVSYYFSTQLAVKTAVLSPAGEAPTAAEVAAALAGGTDGDILAPALPPADFYLQNSTVTVPRGGSEYLAVKVTFHNFDTDQNVYREFGVNANGQDPAPCCGRHVLVVFS